ncbi:MAG: ATP-binding protein [Flavobacterium sp.]|nr:ATP-binding protein [Flavobacterium sp.]
MKKTTSEAPESNAGDDFHVLWSIRKSFELLNFDDEGLKVLSIEGIGIKESTKLDPTGIKLLGVDIVEFYGGENFEKATKVIVSQLKYSTRRINEEWTFYKLYEKKKNKIESSIIYKLSSVFKTFFDEYGRENTIHKLAIKFISNRRFNETQRQTLLNFQKKYSSLKGIPIDYNSIITDFSKSDKTAIEKIYQASNLSAKEFSDFLNIFDVEDCGASSREFLNEEIFNTISTLSVHSTDEYNALHGLMWKKMMPESRINNQISKEDLLMCFKCVLEDLFPVNQKFENIQYQVQREQISDILKVIKNEASKVICLHGGAGIGKSTISQLIIKNIPDYCESLLFDCYGGGDYLNPSDNRHQHRQALTQLSNELAKKMSTPFLLLRQEEKHIFLKQFIKRINRAIEILKKRNPEAYLLLIVDAADNSITASSKDFSVSFVQDLLNENFPAGFKLIVTSRTNRKGTLKLPQSCIDVPLSSFTIAETSHYVKNYFPNLTVPEIEEFHNLTSGIPRVQSYTLDFKKMGIHEVINYLKPNGKEVKDLILDRINDAAKKIGEDGNQIIADFFKLLIALPRPVPLSYLLKLNTEDSAFYTDLSTDIWHGLLLHKNFLSFRDEDFENFIREKYIPGSDTKSAIADLLISESRTSDYASVNLGFALYDAGYKSQLKDIVLENKFRDVPSDPIRSKEVYIDRAKLAMKLSSHEDDKVTYFKLLMIAADEAKKETALTNLLIENAELSAIFSDEASLYKINRNSKESTWGGSFNFKLAAIYSRQEESHKKAKSHLKIVEKWVDLRKGLNKEERRNYRISSEDLAYGMEAYLRLKGVGAAINWINRWKPQEIRLQATLILLDNIFSQESSEQINAWVKETDLPLAVSIVIVNKLFQFEKTTLIDIKNIAEQLINELSTLKFPLYFHIQIIEFSEIVLKLKLINYEDAISILSIIKVKPLDKVPSFYNKYFNSNADIEMDLLLRTKSIEDIINEREFIIEDFYPIRFKTEEEDKKYENRERLSRDKQEFRRFFNLAIPIYRLNASYTIGKIDSSEALTEFYKLTEKIKNDWDLRYYSSHEATGILNFLAVKFIPVIDSIENKKDFINQIIDAAKHKNANQIPLKLLIARTIANAESKHSIALSLLNEIDGIVKKLNLLARDAVEYYTDCAIIAMKINSSIAQYYFNKAVEAVSEIDIQAHDQIKGLSTLTKIGLTNDNPKLANEFARFIEFSYESLSGYDHFPFYDGIVGLLNLDIKSTYAITCRWNHKDIGYFFRSFKTLIRHSLDNNYLDTKVVAALLTIPEDHHDDDIVHIYKTIIQRLTIYGNWQDLNYFLKITIKHFKLRSADSLLQIVSDEIKGNLFIEEEILVELTNYISFQNEISKKRTDIGHKHYKEPIHKHSVDLSKINTTSSKSLEDGILSISKDLESYQHRLTVDDLLVDLKSTCLINDQVSQLDAIIKLDKDVVDFFSIEKALEERLVEWNFNPLVKVWAANKFKTFIELWFSEFVNEGYGLNVWQFYKFSKLFDITDSVLSKIMTDIIASKIDILFSEAIYSAIDLLKYNLTKDENEAIIAWSLQKWNAKIKVEVPENNWDNSLTPPQNHNEVIADTLRYILGHPDKRIRWDAVHAVRRLVNFESKEVLKMLFDKQNRHDCYPFQQKNYTFYWMSAKLYLWVGISRASEENPRALFSFSEDIYSAFLDDSLPHVLIKYFIKRTCQNLIDSNPEIYSNEQINIVNKSLQSNLVPATEDEPQIKSVKSGSRKKTIFKFDYLDTVPYWYARLAKKFNVSEVEVMKLCDKYISIDWNFRGDPQKEDNTFAHGIDYYLTRNDHGSIPTIENLKNYYEYHSMFCAANDLLQNTALKKQKFYKNWKSWLNSNSISWGTRWLYDLTDSIPLEKKFWIEENKFHDKKWKENIDENNYDDAVEIKSSNSFLNVYLNSKMYSGDSTEDILIRSCLVNNSTADALLRALFCTKDTHDYSIPLEKDNYGREIDYKKFKMEGWLKESNAKDDTLDKHDRMAINKATYKIRLGKRIQKISTIDFSSDKKMAYHNGDLISIFENWSNVVDERYHGFENEGGRLKVNKEYILELLKYTDKCLLIKCYIDRQIKDRDYSYGSYTKTVKLYLIKPDGTVRTLREPDFRIGQ